MRPGGRERPSEDRPGREVAMRSALSRAGETAMEINPAAVNSTRTRGDALSEAALVAKRSAEALQESELSRTHLIAGLAGGCGLVALLLIIVDGVAAGQVHLMALLGGLLALAPTLYSLTQAATTRESLVTAAYERGMAQALATQSKRLGDAGGVAVRSLSLIPDAVLHDQMDGLHVDLDRARARLKATGLAISGPPEPTSRLIPKQAATFLTAADGRRYPVRVIEMTCKHVALRGAIPPLKVREAVQIGARKALVVRANPGRAMLQFVAPLLAAEFSDGIVL